MKKSAVMKFAFLLALGATVPLLAADSSTVVDTSCIFEIRPCYGQEKNYASCEHPMSTWADGGKPLDASQALYFNLRMIVPDSNRGPYEESVRNVFMQHYLGCDPSSPIYDEMYDYDLAVHPLKIGIYVNGELDYATLVEIRRTPDKAGTGECYDLYDLIFKYEPKVGDFALPIRLAGDDGKVIPDNYDEAEVAPSTSYKFLNDQYWSIRYVVQHATGEAGEHAIGTYRSNMRFIDMTAAAARKSYYDDSPDKGDEMNTNYSLKGCGFYVKTVDFEDNDDTKSEWEGKDYWKSVKKGSTSTFYLEALAPVITNRPALKVWSDDESVMKIAGGESKTITVYEGGVKKTKKVSMASVSFQNSASISTRFYVTGVESNKTANLTLCGFDDYSYITSGYAEPLMVTNFVTVPVRVTAPEPCSLTLTRIGNKEWQVSNAYDTVLTQLRLTLSEAYTNTMTVTVAPVLKTPGPYLTNQIVRINKEGQDEGWRNEGPLTNIEFAVGEKTKLIDVYGMGADKKYTASVDHEVQFKIVDIQPAAAAAFVKTRTDTAAFLYFKPVAPVALTPAAGAEFEWSANTSYDLEFAVADNYANMWAMTNTGYKIYWKKRAKDTGFSLLKDSSGTARTWCPDSDGYLYALTNGVISDIRPSVTYDAALEDETEDIVSTYYLVAANGAQSAKTQVSVTLLPPPHTPYVRPVIPGTDEPGDPVDCDEGTNITVRIELEEKTTKQYYAYFQLGDTNLYAKLGSTQKYLAVKGKSGLRITKGKNTASASIYFDDGAENGTDFEFNVVLTTNATFSADTIVSDYATNDTQLVTVYNVEPVVTSAKMGGKPPVWDEELGAYKMEQTAAQGIPVEFSMTGSKSNLPFDEPSESDKTATKSDERFQTRYSVYEDGYNLTTNHIVYGNPSSTNFYYSFSTTTLPGQPALVTVEMMDKDMNDTSTGGAQLWSDPFEFYVEVSDKPTISVVTIDGKKSFYEDATDPQESDSENRSFRIEFSKAPTVAQKLKLTVKSLDTETKNPGTLSLVKGGKLTGTTTNGVYLLDVPSGSTRNDVTLDKLDGTSSSLVSGFDVSVEVLTEGSDKTTGQSWKEYYNTVSGTFRVRNSAPQLWVSGVADMPDASKDDGSFRGSCVTQNTNAYHVAASKGSVIQWRVTDVALDMNTNVIAEAEGNIQTNLTVVWTVGNAEQFSTNITDRSKTSMLSFTPDFSGMAGQNPVVMVTVTDKDLGVTRVSWQYAVDTSKSLVTTANGPGSTGSALVQKYLGASGIGEGRVSTKGEKSSVEAFSLTWNCSMAKTVNCYAWGYKVGDVDNGWLSTGGTGTTDIPLDENGQEKAKAADEKTVDGYYKYGDTTRDSFLYGWLQTVDQSTERSSGSTTTTASGKTSTILSIAPERTKAKAPTLTTASMPTEEDDEGGYSPIMLDAIFAKEYLPSDNMGDINADGIPDVYVSKYLFDVFDETTGDMTGNDTTEIDGYNADEDYLPVIETASYAHFIPGLSNTWVTAGRAFTAKLEIRGWGDCLNDAPATSGVANVQADIIYADPDTCPTSTLTRLEWDAYIQAGGTNEANRGWSPERPTNPMEIDTDKDGLSDGYEYYIWYRAHVGYWDNDGTHKYFTGRVYNPADPYNPGVIEPAEIAKLYDPLVKDNDHDFSTLDTDNDGIPDLMEFEIGTSPFDFDTDHDGLPDGYETLISKTDPLKYSTNDSVCDANLNTDRDAMAEVARMMHIIGVIGLSGDTVYYCCDLTTNFVMKIDTDHPVTGTMFQTVSTNGETIVTNKYVTEVANFEKEYTYLDANGHTCLKGDLSKSQAWKLRTATNAEEVVFADKIRGEAVSFQRGTMLANIVSPYEFYNETFDVMPDVYYAAWQYSSGIARGVKIDGTKKKISDRAGITSYTNTVRLMHYYARESGIAPYDPRTGWKWGSGSINSREYTHLDELLSMTFFYRSGALTADDLKASADRTMYQIWKDYSTNPLSADSDLDGMPDGWEFYNMAGEKSSAAPDSIYSPLYDFNLIVGTARDNDGDGLEWPDEYSGIESAAWYASCSTITLRNAAWRNKAWPTDPWSDDTDGDGMLDGAEAFSPFMYNSSGKAGGGLNPLSWDTDKDGLPDPWEAEFYGTCIPGTTSTTTSVADGVTNTITVSSGARWRMDGMDGTVPDARLDYDNDGLANWQEYVVGAMRCWRYDDSVTPWTAHKMSLSDIPSQHNKAEWDQFWYDVLLDDQNVNGRFNPYLANGYIDGAVSYFSCCTNAFDEVNGMFYMFCDGVYHDLKTPPKGKNHYFDDAEMAQFNRFTWKAHDTWDEFSPYSIKTYTYPRYYICCDPRNHDTDYDGMDDYYELFHGMNPILGMPGVLDSSSTGINRPFDLIYSAYAGTHGGSVNFTDTPPPDATRNWWLNGGDNHAAVRLPECKPGSESDGTGYDFVAYPWLNGIASVDPDGDNIVNQEESIMPNVQAVSTYHHSDPTPLWMTDSTYSNSLTRLNYRSESIDADEDCSDWEIENMASDTFEHDGKIYHLADFPCFQFAMGTLSFEYDRYDFPAPYGNCHVGSGWLFSFEENEGYDSDHDFLSDYEEAQGKTKNASNTLDHDDPLRRQAMYFGGEANPSFLQTPISVSEQVPVDEAADEAHQLFLYFTVECWAKPDAETVSDANKLHTLVARSVYSDNSGPADEKLMRRNFLIGVKDGRWYACFDCTAADSNQTVQVANGPTANTEWTHVAATFDGTALRLYVNGTCQGSKQDTTVQPEHGVQALAVNEAGEMNPDGGTEFFSSRCITITVGAAPRNLYGIIYDYAWRYRSYANIDETNPFGLASHNTSFADYGDWYKGYIDEVRIWDGARSASDILSDCENRTRYTTALAEENRQAVYAQWKSGGRRADTATVQLPAQLMYHWAFDHIAGAVQADDLIQVPAGFATDKTITDAKARWVRPDDWVENCWANSAVKSTVYTDNSWVPWINNTVSHLPRFDLTTLDSVYWSEDYAGASSAATNGYTSFQFPRSNEVYSRWSQQTYEDEHYYDSHYDPYFDSYNVGPLLVTYAYSQKTRYNTITGYNDMSGTNTLLTINTEDHLKLRFAARDRNIVGDDILPMGGAYPRRIGLDEGGMWDAMQGEEPQSSDAWAQTGPDADNNGLPDWWEDYARENYCKNLPPHTAIEWATTVDYYGTLMPAYQAYLRDLAKGLVKVGDTVEYAKDEDGNYIYADKRDTDKDGLPDWWEELYGLDTTTDNADEDPDNDGLSNYQEYIIGEVYPTAYNLSNPPYNVAVGSAKLNPTLTYTVTNQVVPDYYMAYSTNFVDVKASPSHFFLNEYFGEMATDHDFMEDWWESQYDVDYTSMKVYDPLDDKDGDGWSTWAECRSSLWGNSFSADLISKWTGTDSSQYVICRPQPIVGVRATYYGKQDISGKQLVVRTTSGQTQRTDATFVVPPSLDGQTKYIGGFDGDSVLHGHLSPGLLNVNSIIFSRAQVNSEKVYMWNCDWYKENAPDDTGWTKGSYSANGVWVSGYLPWSSCDRVKSGSFDDYKTDYEQWPHIELEGGDFSWESFVQTVPTADLSGAKLLIDDVTEFGWVDCTTGEYELDMSKFTGDGSVDEYVFNVTYTSRLGEDWPQTVYLSDTKELETTGVVGIGEGYVREGDNTIEAFMDLDEDGQYTAGEPYGVVQNVDVGWHKTPVVTIELKDTSHVVPRFDISASTDDRTVVEGTIGSGSTEEASATGEDSTGLTKVLQISRLSVNDDTEVAQRTLLTKTLVLDSRSYLTEADVLTLGKFDLDSKWLKRDWEKLGYERAEIEKATYQISEVLTDVNGNTSNVVLKTFVNTFKADRTVPAVVSPVDDAPVYANSPTFAFACGDETMTAYRLQVRKAGDKTAANLIYDSGITLLPGREPDTVGVAVCNVTPDIHVGLGGLEDGASYEWRVALYNAKFPDDEETAWSARTDAEWAKFQMDVDNANRYPKLATGYGRKTLAVRYYGPATNLTTDTAIYVEAFEGADFRGQPAARTKVSLPNLTDLKSRTDITFTNAVLKGLAPGKWFVRAYIDFNTNGVCDTWESWGYVNSVGKGMKAIYNPIDIEVTASTANWTLTDVAQYTLFIEDCDTNKNEIPDCLEGEDNLVQLKDSDGDGISDSDEKSLYGTDPYKADTDDDGMPDGYEVWTDLDPTSPDSDTCMDGDVMAMALDTDGENLLRHAAVYAAYGFDPTTAKSEDGANTVPFTAIEKYGVISYLDKLGLIPYDHAKYSSGEDYVNRNRLWEQYALKADTSDSDGDGVADGWELYVMFGPNGTNGVSKLSDAKISPWNKTDGAKVSPGDKDLPADAQLTLLGEFKGDKTTDPWVTDTDGDNVIDRYYHDYMLWDSGADPDGDGLSNYAEYLISKVFKFAELDPSNPKTNGSVVDYFRKEGELYYGEMFTDHDRVDDTWEQSYDKFANRYVYDPSSDDDGDGWSNYAEAKAGTHPGAVASPGVGYSLAEYPIPVIAAKVIYSGKQTLSGALNFQCWSQVTDAGMVGEPDATWTSDSASQTNATRYVGINPGKECRYYLGTGAVSPGTVCLRFRDMAYETAVERDGTLESTNSTETGYAYWYPVVQDNGYGTLYTSVSNMVRVAVGTVDYATGETVIDFGCAALQGYTLDDAINGTIGSSTTTRQSGTYSNADRINLTRSYVLIEWTPVKIATTGNTTYYLSAATGGKGHVREGKQKFVVWCDMADGTEGKYDPGEPFGFVRDVDVGWQGGSFEVQLTETSPVFARIDLRADDFDRCSDRQVWQEGDSTVTDIGDGSTASATLCTKMGVTTKKGDDELDLSTTRLTRIRVTRVLVNGVNEIGITKTIGDAHIKDVVLDKYLDLGTRSYIHEGDFLTDGAFDCDWATMQDQVVNKQVVLTSRSCILEQNTCDATNVTYAIVIGEGAIGASNLVFRCVVNKTFDPYFTRTSAWPSVVKPVIDATQPQDLVYGSRPTFRFAMRDPEGNNYNSYTAFKLKITTDGGTEVYDSGFRSMPPCDSNGWYSWTLDEPIGAKIPASGNYRWKVALYNAKYQSGTYQGNTITEWSDAGTFVVNMNNQQAMNDHGYSSVAAAVKYAGPSAVLKKGKCIVQAFETADFAGVPAGQSYVTDDIDETASVVANAVIKGLPQTGTYYLRAFIDMDGDRTIDDFESWGAASEAVTLTKDVVTMPTVGIWIEDADTDGDWLPDAWEYAKYGNLTSLTGEIFGGDKIVFSSTFSTSTAGISTGLSGASLTIFQNPLAKDLLPDFDFTTTVSIADIRAAVEKNGNPTTVKITALTLSPDGKTVTLSVAAEVTDSIAGELLSRQYNLTNLGKRTADVTIHVYEKESLATAEWTEIGTGFAATVGANQVEIPVDVSKACIDMSSGFYKIEVTQP